MKYTQLLIPFILITACAGKHSDRIGNTKHIVLKDTVIVHDTVFYNENNWQKGFGLTHNPEIDSIWGKPVKFYIDNPKCSPIAIDFYQGQFCPTDNNTTAALLSLVTTNDNNLRPFYRWCLNKTIQIQDGALAEYTGVPARHYAEKYSKEFFEYMDYDTTGNKYAEWVNAIMYSGFYDEDDYRKPQDIRKRMAHAMKTNCRDCDERLEKRIDKFAAECFP